MTLSASPKNHYAFLPYERVTTFQHVTMSIFSANHRRKSSMTSLIPSDPTCECMILSGRSSACTRPTTTFGRQCQLGGTATNRVQRQLNSDDITIHRYQRQTTTTTLHRTTSSVYDPFTTTHTQQQTTTTQTHYNLTESDILIQNQLYR